MSKPFTKITCPDCQAICDTQQLFLTIEQIAKRQNIEPERMAAALSLLAADWAVMTMVSRRTERDRSIIDAGVLKVAAQFALTIREQAEKYGRALLSAQFKPDTKTIADAREARRHAH